MLKPKYLERAFELKRNLRVRTKTGFGSVQNLGVTTDARNAAFRLPKDVVFVQWEEERRQSCFVKSP